MVKDNSPPTFQRMTPLTSLFPGTVMDVIDEMTGDTNLGSIFIGLV
jgi:hypothetical protein